MLTVFYKSTSLYFTVFKYREARVVVCWASLPCEGTWLVLVYLSSTQLQFVVPGALVNSLHKMQQSTQNSDLDFITAPTKNSLMEIL